MIQPVEWSVNIEPEVTTEYAGTTLGAYYTNPDVLVETEVRGRRKFYDLYGYGSPEVISVEASHLFYVCATALGAQLVFPEDTSPQIQGRVLNTLEDIKRLRIPEDIGTCGLVPYVIQRYEYLKKKSEITGITPVFGLPNQSPLGTAIVLRGTDLFYDIMTHPDDVKALLEIITETALRIIRFQEAFTGTKVESVGMDDDYGGLVSPETYEEFNFPYMKRIYDTFGKHARSLHTETLSKGHLKFLRRLGITNYDAWPYHNLSVEDVLEELPDIFFTWNCETTDGILSDTPSQIKENFRAAVAAGAPGMTLDLCARGVPEENIRAFIEVAREFESR